MKSFTALVVLLLASFSDAFISTSHDAFLAKSATKASFSALSMTVLAHKGKKANFRAGSPLKNACSKLGVKPKYSCRK